MLPICENATVNNSDNETKTKKIEYDGSESLTTDCVQQHHQDVEEEEDDVSASETSETDSDFDQDCVLSNNLAEKLPEFGNISVKNSTDIHFGNKTFYQGPVTIKQIVYTNPPSEPLAIKSGEVIVTPSEKDILEAASGNGVFKNLQESDKTPCNGINIPENKSK